MAKFYTGNIFRIKPRNESPAVSGLTEFFGRPDGGLIALTVSTITIVAGLKEWAGLENILNVRILVGGLSVSLFFSILCVYFTMFGMRATSTSAEIIGSKLKFEGHLVFPVEWGGSRFLGFSLPILLLVFLLPSVPLIISQIRENSNTESIYKSLSEKAENFNEMCRIKQKNWTIIDAESEEVKKNCIINYNKYKSELKDLKSKKSDSAHEKNIRALIAILLYLSFPIVLWIVTPSLSAIKEYDKAMALKCQIQSIQELRLVAAFTALATFMLGSGMALINTSVTNVSDGLAIVSPPIPVSSPFATEEKNPKAEPQSLVNSSTLQIFTKEGISCDPLDINYSQARCADESASSSASLFPSDISITLKDDRDSSLPMAPIVLNGELVLKADSLAGAMSSAPPQVVILPGPKGDKGDSGTPGIKGDKGDPGNTAVVQPGSKNLTWECKGIIRAKCTPTEVIAN